MPRKLSSLDCKKKTHQNLHQLEIHMQTYFIIDKKTWRFDRQIVKKQVDSTVIFDFSDLVGGVDLDSVRIVLALLPRPQHADPGVPDRTGIPQTLAEKVVPVKGHVVSHPEYFPAEILLVDNKVGLVRIEGGVHEIPLSVLLVHVVQQVGHAHFLVAGKVCTADHAEGTILFVLLDGRPDVLHLAPVLVITAGDRDLVQHLLGTIYSLNIGKNSSGREKSNNFLH